MKNILKYIGIVLGVMAILNACSLEEYNPSSVDLEKAYKYQEGYDGLVNSCYINLYYLYGKIDGIGAMEMGTDLWTNVSNNETAYLLYNSNMNTSLGTLRVIWGSLYSTVNLCNTAIYYADDVVDFDEDALNARLAEVYFLRAFSNFHIVEQFGNVVLHDKSILETGAEVTASRTEEEEFYDMIMSDLEFAVEHLPVSQTERGRASKKAALGLLTKVYLQRTRLGEEAKYAELALNAAEELINNQVAYECELYTSDTEMSGFEKLWDGDNNKDNKEFLFLEAIDHETGINPEGWNRGRTRQYYEADLKTVGSSWGMAERSLVYGRANARNFKPTKYLLTTVFEPNENTADTRFASTFHYKYYAYNRKKITSDIIDLFDKDASLEDYVIPLSKARGNTEEVMAANFYANIGWTSSKSYEGFLNTENDSSVSIFTPNWNIPKAEKRLMPRLVNDPSDMFNENGTWTENLQRKEIYPSLKKFSSLKYCYTEQYHMGDFPILRLGDIYLLAAEAALIYNNDQAKALTYVNEIRKRAARTDRENEMIVTADKMTIDFILEERGRELAGEQWRWYDLKRTGKLSVDFFSKTNPEITEFNPALHIKRPIPISFLNSIANAEEFGTNGY